MTDQPKPRPPIVPRSLDDPIGQAGRIARAERDFKRRLSQLAREVQALYEPVLVGGAAMVRVTNRQ